MIILTTIKKLKKYLNNEQLMELLELGEPTIKQKDQKPKVTIKDLMEKSMQIYKYYEEETADLIMKSIYDNFNIKSLDGLPVDSYRVVLDIMDKEIKDAENLLGG